MTSSSQIKKSPVSAIEPAPVTIMAIRPVHHRSPPLTAVQEEMVTDAISDFFLSPERRSQCQTLRAYRARCLEANVQPVSGVTFLRRLRGLTSLPQPQRSHFLAVAQIDETIIDLPVLGGASS